MSVSTSQQSESVHSFAPLPPACNTKSYNKIIEKHIHCWILLSICWVNLPSKLSSSTSSEAPYWSRNFASRRSEELISTSKDVHGSKAASIWESGITITIECFYSHILFTFDVFPCFSLRFLLDLHWTWIEFTVKLHHHNGRPQCRVSTNQKWKDRSDRFFIQTLRNSNAASYFWKLNANGLCHSGLN